MNTLAAKKEQKKKKKLYILDLLDQEKRELDLIFIKIEDKL